MSNKIFNSRQQSVFAPRPQLISLAIASSRYIDSRTKNRLRLNQLSVMEKRIKDKIHQSKNTLQSTYRQPLDRNRDIELSVELNIGIKSRAVDLFGFTLIGFGLAS
ncbi:MAG: hypothetical protein WCF23_13800 [Candidatus Nitrosopolaris sp.]